LLHLATADCPQLLLAHLAAANPSTYFGVLDSSIRKEIDSGKLLQAAQLIRQGLGFYSSSSNSSSSSSSDLAAARNPSLTAELLQDPAAVTAMASAVACLTKVWIAAFQHAHEQGSSSSSSSKGGSSSRKGGSSSSSGIAPGSPEEFDFCVAATKRMLQLGLGSVLDWLLQINSTKQQQQQGLAASTAAGACSTSSSSSSSTRQATASSLFLLLVVARSALLTQHVICTVAQQQQQQQALPNVPAVNDNGSNRASAQPSVVLQESDDVLQELYAKCIRLLTCLQDTAAAKPAAAAAAAAGADSNSNTVQPPTVVWESLLQLQTWLQQTSSSSNTSSNGQAADGNSTSTAMEGCMQLVAALPLPELCNNLSCGNFGGISEAAAAKKRCSGCKISRYAFVF
jgi:hypothetical protein